MSDVALKVGDVVQLNSGGPMMTVREHYEDDKWACTWFDGAEVYSDVFPAAVLNHVPRYD